MKKAFAVVAVVALALVACAALDFAGAKATPVINPGTISSGATNSVIFAKGTYRGTGEVIVQAGAAYGRTELNATLWATNRTEGGWTVYATGSTANTNAVVLRVAFPGEYLPKDVKLTVGSIGAASTASAMILTY